MGKRVSKQKPMSRSLADLANYDDLPYSVRNDSRLSWEQRDRMLEEIRQEKATQAKKFDAIAGVYQVADRILTQSSVDVKIGNFNHLSNNSGTPAWNDGKSIYFNTDVLKDLTDDTIVSLNGINYHEVAHIIFSPRLNGEFCSNIIKRGLLTGFNILEDQRIETLLISRFPSTEVPLTKAILSYIIESGGVDSFPLIHGRKYISVDIRQEVANQFASKHGLELTNKIASLVNEYRLLAFPVDSKRALEIIIEFSKLLNLPSNSGEVQVDELGEYQVEALPDTNGTTPKCSDGLCGSRLPLRSGRNESGKKQQEQVTQAQGSDTNPDVEPKENNGESVGESAGEQVPFNPNAVEAEVPDTLASLVKSAIEDLMNSAKAKREVKQIRNAIYNAVSGLSNCPTASYTIHPVDIEYRKVAKAFAEELTELVIDNDPAWNTHNPTGKLNIQRTMNMDPNDINSIFDRWDTGSDKFDIEAVILLDNSGSMDSIMKQAVQNMWVIKKAIEEIGGRVTVIAFDEQARLVYSGDDKANNTFRAIGANGGTNPFRALVEAESVLADSQRATKLLFTVSDGQWGSDHKCEEIIERINLLEGAVSSAVLLMNGYWYDRMSPKEIAELVEKSRHKCQTVSGVFKPNDLVGVARKLLRSL